MKLFTFTLAILLSLSAVAQQQLTLEEAIDIAMENSPDVQTSLLNLERNQELLNAQLASQKTQFSFEITPFDFVRSRQYNEFFGWYTNERFSNSGSLVVSQPVVATDGTITLRNQLGWQNQITNPDAGAQIDNKAYSNNLFLSFNQPLFTYNRLKMAYSELETSFENSEISYSIQVLNIERSVTQAYFDVLREQESLSISEDEYANQQTNYEIIKNKAETGLIAMEELFQAEVNLANSRSSLQNQQVSVENVKDDFKILLGLDLFQDFSLTSGIDVETVPVDLSVAIESGLKSRREIRQREIDIQNAENSLIRTKATNEFRGDLSLSVGIFGENENFGGIYEDPRNNPRVSTTPRVSLGLTIPIWDWGERKHRINADMASIRVQELNLTNQENDIIIGIRRSYRNLLNLENQISIAEQSVQNAQRTYDINQERYANGDITGIDLNQYQNQLSQSRIDLLVAKINYRLELLNMKIQSLWDFNSNSSVVLPDINDNK